MDNSTPVKQLLKRGLDHYGRNEIADAIRCWQEALSLAPDEPLARDYLESAGVELQQHRAHAKILDFAGPRAQLVRNVAKSAPSSGEVPTTLERSAHNKRRATELEALLRDKRYEEALTLLRSVQREAPDDLRVERSIRLLSDRLCSVYERRLTELTLVPYLVQPPVRASSEELRVMALVDGQRSYAEIVSESPLDRLSSLRALCALSEGKCFSLNGPDSVPPTARSLVPGMELRATMDNAFGHHRSGLATEPSPTSGVIDTGPSSQRSGDAHAELFRRATEAYLVRNFELAFQLFGECCRQWPDDRRSLHNLNVLKRRIGKT